MSAKAKAVLVAIGALFLTCACCYGLIWVYNEVGLLGERFAAHKVGVEPTINDLSGYIVEKIEIGMSRDEVENILGTIAPLRVERGTLNKQSTAGWGPIACDRIGLRLTPLPGHEWPIIACYDSEDGLVNMKFSDPDFPPLGISAPVRE